MKQHIGEEADGHISGVTDFGVFVQLDESRCEGLVRINRLVPGDYMVYDEKNYRLIAEESGKTFTLGDPMRVKIIRADAEKRQIDFKPAEGTLPCPPYKSTPNIKDFSGTPQGRGKSPRKSHEYGAGHVNC